MVLGEKVGLLAIWTKLGGGRGGVRSEESPGARIGMSFAGPWIEGACAFKRDRDIQPPALFHRFRPLSSIARFLHRRCARIDAHMPPPRNGTLGLTKRELVAKHMHLFHHYASARLVRLT